MDEVKQIDSIKVESGYKSPSTAIKKFIQIDKFSTRKGNFSGQTQLFWPSK